MKRVQLILEAWQHQWLAQEAEREETSMSALLREMLTQAIELRRAQNLDDDPLWGVVGMAAGPDDGITSENLDDYIYQPAWQAQPTLKIAEDGPDHS